jgi:CheY-like chemotaxis protein
VTQVVSDIAPGSEIGHGDPLDDFVEVDRKLVLIVEDEPTLLEVMSFVLESEGFRVEVARNGEEALERLRTGTWPALVLLDLMMPVMSGREFLDEIARSPALASLPIVVLTAGGPPEVPGAAEVLPKPYDLELLIEAVERHTRGRRASPRAR